MACDEVLIGKIESALQEPAPLSTHSPGGQDFDSQQEPKRSSRSSRPIFPNRITGDALRTQTSPTGTLDFFG